MKAEDYYAFVEENESRLNGDASNDSADKVADEAAAPAVTMDDLLAYLPTHQYIFRKTRDLWPPASVNAVIPPILGPDKKSIKPSVWLDGNQAVQQMTWAPGEAELIKDRLILNGAWIKAQGCACFNLYVPPTKLPGNADEAGPWREHLRRIYPDEADHIEKWLAHRVQRPAEKVNHALLLGGGQGIGKDTIVEPVIHAIGAANFHEVSPVQMLGRFNSFVKSVILRVSEARDLGEMDRYAFYEHMKIFTASPPDVLRCDEKNLREHSVMNVCGVIMTTNHRSSGIYLPPDDRRHFVAWSTLTTDQLPRDYFRQLYAWYGSGGIGHVAAFLAAFDLSKFDAKAPPPKTAAFWAIVDANRSLDDAALADVLDMLGNPAAVTLAMLDGPQADPDFRAWIQDRRNRRLIPHRLEAAGYVPVRSETKDGLWTIGAKRQVIYARETLCDRDRKAEAKKLCSDARYQRQSETEPPW